MNSKKIVALLLCLGLSFQSTALSGVLYDENAVVKASAEESGKTHSGRASVAVRKQGTAARKQCRQG